MGFQSSNYDPSLFISRKNGQLTLILVYVDDIIITGNDPTLIQQCITYLSNRFTIRDLGQIHFFLGVQVTSSDKGLFLSQTKYPSDLLVRANMLNCKPILSPMASGTNFSQIGMSGSLPFSQHCGCSSVCYVDETYISFSVNKIPQFMHNPTEEHWSAVKRILRYVAGTLQYGIKLFKDSNFQIHAYSDADWAGSIDDRRSTSGFCIYLGKNIISWQAKKQATVSRSNTEAEYRSLASACTEIMWVDFLLKEITLSSHSIPILWCDNIGAIFLAANPQFHARTKHIDIDFHFVREKIVSNKLKSPIYLL
jgi:Reverse transcriptase (RNA-dependent DNA polymerase)